MSFGWPFSNSIPDPWRDGYDDPRPVANQGGRMKPGEIWTSQCEAARRIEDDFGTRKALDYLVGEKFLNFLEAAETHPEFRAEVPAFVAGIKAIFERWQPAACRGTARESGQLCDCRDGDDDGPELVEEERKSGLGRCAAGLLRVEQAKEWLLGDGV